MFGSLPVTARPPALPASFGRDIFTATPSQTAQVGGAFYGWGGGTSYFGAQTSDARGQLILPTKWTEDQLRTPARTVLALKTRVLAESYGPAGALWNLASLIGGLKVQAKSGDPKWDKLAEDYFNRVTTSALTFDAGGRQTLATYQVLATYRRFLDGDMFTVLTRSQSGHARVMGYEGLLVDTGLNQQSPEWIDGVQCDIRTRFPLAYNFCDRGPKGETTNKVLPASAVIHHSTQRSFAGRRGTPALAHCLNNFHDLIESDGFIKQAIKVAALIGITRKSDPGANASPFNLGVAAPLQQTLYQSPTAAAAPTTVPAANLKFEEAVEGGLISTAPFEVVHDERPHPNWQEQKKALFRESAVGLGFPQQILFYMDDPGGAWTRTILELTAKAIADHHANYQAPFVRRIWAYTISVGIQKGDIPAPQKGNWLNIRLTPPRNITADLGKMGNLNIALREHLQTTFLHLYEELGLDWETELEQNAIEFRYLMDLEIKYDLPPGTLQHAVLPQQASAAMLAPDPPPSPSPSPS